ncbi:hypothetical protein QYM36_015352 [Artemia franciscana]|uniref:Uncharacterized protein n=1 Tax=Artemia franciscana TaxID=6661 RepID=A0AA88HC24_ARTSF|nr:hypothetical protein QYM36_015352 [Artemia franciscana]
MSEKVFKTSSTKRWSYVLKSLLRSEESCTELPLTLKELCITQWETRIDALKAVRFQIVEDRRFPWDFYDDPSFQDDIRRVANSFATTLED